MPKLSVKDKMAIIRSQILTQPDSDERGFNRKLINYIKETYNVSVHESHMSKLVKRVYQEWEDTQDRFVEKNRLVDMFLKMYSETDNEFVKVKCLTEIGKLEGHYKVIIEKDKPDEKPTILVSSEEKKFIEGG